MESITLQTSDPAVSGDDVLGRLAFAASNESSTSDARLVAAMVKAVAEDDFTSIANPTSLVFSTAISETATDKLKLTSSGHLIPFASGSFDLGSSSNPFRNLYVDNLVGFSLSLSGNLTGNINLNSYSIVGNGDISINGNIIANTGTLDVLTFNTNNESILAKGQLSWDDTEGTLDIGLTDNTTIHIGEHRYFRIRNQTGSPLYKGQVVYATGVHSNGLITPAKYVADGTVREVRFMGLVLEDVDDNNNGYVIDFGHLENMDLDGSATNYAVGDETWSAGDILYVHPTVAGKLTKNEPKHGITVAIILDTGNGNGGGRMFVRPTSYGHLDDNHDVAISGATNGQFLQYNSVTDYWVPSSSGNFTTLQVNGTLVPTGVGTSNYVTKWTGTNSIGNSVIYDNGTSVGIGTASPSYKLDVAGNIQAYGSYAKMRTVDGSVVNRLQSSSFDAIGYIGTESNHGLIIKTNNLDRVTIDTNGNVGIGTTSPSYTLDVRSSSSSQVNVGNTIAGGASAIRFADTAIRFQIGKEATTHDLVIESLDGGIDESIRLDYNTGSVTFNETGADMDFRVEGFGQPNALFVDGSNGNVGIGTASPSARLNVEAGNVIFNDLGGNYDFRVEGDTDTNLLFTDASTDRVGIKTSTPTVDLEVGTNNSTPRALSVRYSSVPAYLSNGFDGTYSRAVFSTNIYNTSNGSFSWSSPFGNTNYSAAAIDLTTNAFGGGSQIRFYTATINNTEPTERMHIDGDGNVGIGTSSPLSRLELLGNGSTSNTGILTISDPSSGGTTSWIKLYAEDSFGFDPPLTWHIAYGDLIFFRDLEFRTSFSSVPEVTIEPSGDFHVVGDGSVHTPRYKAFDLVTSYNTAAKPAFTWVNDDDNGMFLPTSNNIAFSTAGLERLRINSNGNVGIGTNNPTEKLDVNGSIKTRTGGVGHEDNGCYVAYPGGGTYKSAVSTETGYLKITLPVSWTNTMISFDIDIYEYTTQKIKKLRVGGYTYSVSTQWINESAMMDSDNDFAKYKVHFGHDGTNCAVYISRMSSLNADLGATTTWNVPQISISNIFAGYGNMTMANWADGWTVGFTTTLGTTTGSIEVSRPYRQHDTSYVFNEYGGNVDFRVEGDTLSYLLHTDASKDEVVIHNAIGYGLNYATSEGWVQATGTPTTSQVGYYGGNFTANGAAENYVDYSDLPNGLRGLVWQSRDNGADSTNDGGWDKEISGLDPNKTYVSIVYFRRVGSSTTGIFYHGCKGTNTLNLNGTTNGNPYFHSWGMANFPQDVWCVSIGIIHANNDTISANTGFGGIYRLDTGEKIYNFSTDYKMAASATIQTHRTYLYADAVGNTDADWCWPGFYEVTADSIVNLLNTILYDHFSGRNITINEGGGNFDFRVEGDTDTNLLFTDASTDRVGIGTSSPTQKLQVITNQLEVAGFNFAPSFGPLAPKDLQNFIIESRNDSIILKHLENPLSDGVMELKNLIRYSTDFISIDAAYSGVLGITYYPKLKVNTSTGATTFNDAYTLPTADGTAGQALVTNGSGVVSWSDIASANLTRGSFEVTSTQSTFTVSGGYTLNTLSVYYNGVKLLLGTDFTATNGTTFTLTNAAVNGDIVEYWALNSASSAVGNTSTGSVSVTSNQTVFNVTNGYTVGGLVVFVNGVKLVDGVDFTATNGSSFTLTSAATSGDVVDYVAYGAVVASSNLQKTGDTMTGNLTVNADVLIGSGNSLTIGQGGSDSFTLPDADGSANQIIETDGSGNLSWVNKPQVVTNVYTGKTTYSVASAGNIGTYIAVLNTSITPTKSSSRIRVELNISFEHTAHGIFRLFRSVNGGADAEVIRNDDGNYWSGWAIPGYDVDNSSTPRTNHHIYIDSPNTTLPVTYKFMIQSAGEPASTFFLNRSVSSAGGQYYENAISQVILTEIPQ